MSIKIRFKRVLCAALMLVVLGSSTGCAAFRTFPKFSKALEKEKKGKSVEGRIGDELGTFFFRFSAEEARLAPEYEGFVPEDGEQLLIVKMKLKNTYRESITMFDTDFQITWDDISEDAFALPLSYNRAGGALSAEELPTEYELGVDEEKEGLLIFAVPEDREDFALSYLEMFQEDENSTRDGDLFIVYFTAQGEDA